MKTNGLGHSTGFRRSIPPEVRPIGVGILFVIMNGAIVPAALKPANAPQPGVPARIKSEFVFGR